MNIFNLLGTDFKSSSLSPCPPSLLYCLYFPDHKFCLNDSLENEQIFGDTFITSRILLIRGFGRLRSGRGGGERQDSRSAYPGGTTSPPANPAARMLPALHPSLFWGDGSAWAPPNPDNPLTCGLGTALHSVLSVGPLICKIFPRCKGVISADLLTMVQVISC